MRKLLAVFAAGLLTGCASHYTRYASPAGTPAPPSMATRPATRLVMIGDGGLPGRQRDSVLHELTNVVSLFPERTHTLFLGDNVYERGVVAGDTEAESRLEVQVRAATVRGARATFVPGNHDWKAGSLHAAANVVARAGENAARWLPTPAGCPGPHVVDDVAPFRLVLLDTDLLLRDAIPAIGCNNVRTLAHVTDSLRRVLQATPTEQQVIVVGHHPLRSVGRHGKCRFILFCRKQDLEHSSYRDMRQAVLAALESRPVLLYAAGHDHSLQVFRGTRSSSGFSIVSGAASKLTEVRKADDLLYGQRVAGFMVLDVMPDGTIWLHVVEVLLDAPDTSTSILLMSGNRNR